MIDFLERIITVQFHHYQLKELIMVKLDSNDSYTDNSHDKLYFGICS